MIVQYIPTEEDYINLNLFLSAQVSQIRKQAKAQKYIVQIIFAVVAVIEIFKFSTKHNFINLFIFFAALCVCIFYPTFNLWIYKKNIKKRFKRICKNGDDLIVTLSIDENELSVADSKGRYSMETSNIAQIVEVTQYIFIKIREELYLMIPKKQIDNLYDIRTELLRYIEKFNIPYVLKDDWNNNLYSKKSAIR